MTKKLDAYKIATNGLVAAVYFVLCVVSAPIAYGQIQFRIAEMLVLLCFWRRDLIIGVTLGCLLANTTSTLGPLDMVFGTLATLVSCVLVAYSPRLYVAAIWPIAINAFVVAGELYYLAEIHEYWLSVGYVAAGEAAVVVGSYILWVILARSEGFMRALKPDAHIGIRY